VCFDDGMRESSFAARFSHSASLDCRIDVVVEDDDGGDGGEEEEEDGGGGCRGVEDVEKKWWEGGSGGGVVVVVPGRVERRGRINLFLNAGVGLGIL